MSITLEDISCLLHLPIRGGLLDHRRIIKDEALEMMVDPMGDDPGEAKDWIGSGVLMLGLNT